MGHGMSNNWMSPRDYFERIVKPTVEEYWVDRSDHHKENAILQLSSFSERFFKFHKEQGNTEKVFAAEEFGQFHKKIFEKCAEFGLLWDAANAVKHHFPDGHTRPGAMVRTATTVWDTEEHRVGDRWVSIDQAIGTVYGFWRDLVCEDLE